ncbi:uncharacterized protein [Dermacentor andersoni]|uniref:uncharacterized protein n=1 Tax=Dermacentor andersoni TaxID=34620 RepID=UPI002416F716|nr:uncharacterized protein LOC126544587 [Dermacentor andersoni]
MTGVVLLRDFECGIPKDLRVTFVDQLPEDALCIQCDNVSARLYRDLLGHGYCKSCRAMCERGGAFACATCEKAYKTWELTADFSAPDKIKKLRVICPKSSEREPVHITFSALKAHLKHCFCNEVAKKTEGSSTRSYATVRSPPPSAKQQSAAHSADKKEETIVVKVSVCPVCSAEMPKKLIGGHMKECIQKQQDSLHYLVSLPEQEIPESFNGTGRQDPFDEVGMSHAANKFTAEHTSPFESRVYPPRNEHPVSSAESSELARLLQEALSKISHLENEVTELKKAANKEKDEMEMLQVAVPTIQGDMRNVQIQCEQRIAKSEKMVSSLEECHDSLQETLSVINEETKVRLGAVEEAMKEMNERYYAAVPSLQEQSWDLHRRMENFSAQLAQMRNDFNGFVHKFDQEQEEHGQGKKGHRRFK